MVKGRPGRYLAVQGLPSRCINRPVIGGLAGNFLLRVGKIRVVLYQRAHIEFKNIGNGGKLADTPGISTGELWARLFKAPSIGSYLDEHSGTTLPTFADYIVQLSEERGLKHEAVIAQAGLERSFGYRLFNGTRKPSRDTVLQLAFGLGLDCDAAQQLLKVAGASALHPKVKRDAVIAYCLHNRRKLMDAQELLYEYGLPLLGGARHE